MTSFEVNSVGGKILFLAFAIILFLIIVCAVISTRHEEWEGEWKRNGDEDEPNSEELSP